MNRTMTVVIALIVAAGLTTMAYAVPEQRALAWGGFGFGGCGFGCGGGFFVHKHIIQTISQTNTCLNPSAHTPSPPPPPGKVAARGGNGGSGGAAGSGGEGGLGGKDAGDITSTNKANINQAANGGNSNGGHAGNANGGDARNNGNGNDQKAAWAVPMDSGVNQDHNQKDKQVVCLNTAVNNAGHGFGAGSDNLGQSDVPDNLLR
ncbi:MAG: hypothetical protein WB988_04310 [Candidatus Nitrosopolaris sp.]